MNILIQFNSILVLGLIGGSVPGPILTSVLTESFRRGFARSLLVIIKGLISEIIVATIVLSVFFYLHVPEAAFYAISLIGAGVLIWLASQVWKINKIGDEEGEIFSFLKIFLLTIFNGAFWLFWITVCVPQAFSLKKSISWGPVLFIILFESGWLIVNIFWSFVFSRFRPLLIRKNFVPVVFKIFSLILLVFALNQAFESAIFFLKLL